MSKLSHKKKHHQSGEAAPPVEKPGKRLLKFVPLQFVAKGHGGKLSGAADLNVTPMVDMLTMLVIFLLMSFSASGEILFITKDIQLPKAFNAVELARSPVIALSAETISFNGTFVMKTAEANDQLYPDWKLLPLFGRLEETKQQWQEEHADKKFEGEAAQVIVQGDSDVPFQVIKMVMFTCGQLGYTGLNFAVESVGRSGSVMGAP